MKNFNYTETFTVEVSVNEIAEKLYSNLDTRKDNAFRTQLVETIVENCLTNNGNLGRLYSALNHFKKDKIKGRIDLSKHKDNH